MTASNDRVPALPGTILGDKYQIERVLGEGGMGVVLSAIHLQLGQRVALKCLLDHMRGDPQIVERFLREARAAARLRSEHVGRVIDVGTLETGAPFIVMEFLDGHDLAAELVQRGRVPHRERPVADPRDRAVRRRHADRRPERSDQGWHVHARTGAHADPGGRGGRLPRCDRGRLERAAL